MNDEVIDLVNENNKIIGEVLKSKAHNEKLWHREVGVIIINDKNEILLQQRARNKRYPLKWVISAGGHINVGEKPEDAAYRELDEELGIRTDLKFIELKKGLGRLEHNFIYWYIGVYNDPITDILESEIDNIEFFSKESFKEKFKINKIEELEHKKGFLYEVSIYAAKMCLRFWNGEFI